MGLTRIRLQPAIYFCLHRGSLPKNAEGGQPRIQGEIVPKNFGKNYMSCKIAQRRDVV